MLILCGFLEGAGLHQKHMNSMVLYQKLVLCASFLDGPLCMVLRRWGVGHMCLMVLRRCPPVSTHEENQWFDNEL